MKDFVVDINADVGEGIGNEAQLMPYISSCNIACGGHAGDEDTMRSVVKLSKKHRVKIGAHPSFPDKENFGRLELDMSCAALFASLEHQINALLKILRSENATLHHIKPHGALYNLSAVNERVAKVVIEVVKGMELPTRLYVPYGSVIERLALKEGVKITYEAFADRNYNEDLTLVPRHQENALIHDPKLVFQHVYNIVLNGNVKTITGLDVPIKAQTFCVHGDTSEAIAIVKELKEQFEHKGIKVL